MKHTTLRRARRNPTADEVVSLSADASGATLLVFPKAPRALRGPEALKDRWQDRSLNVRFDKVSKREFALPLSQRRLTGSFNVVVEEHYFHYTGVGDRDIVLAVAGRVDLSDGSIQLTETSARRYGIRGAVLAQEMVDQMRRGLAER